MRVLSINLHLVILVLTPHAGIVYPEPGLDKFPS